MAKLVIPQGSIFNLSRGPKVIWVNLHAEECEKSLPLSIFHFPSCLGSLGRLSSLVCCLAKWTLGQWKGPSSWTVCSVGPSLQVGITGMVQRKSKGDIPEVGIKSDHDGGYQDRNRECQGGISEEEAGLYFPEGSLPQATIGRSQKRKYLVYIYGNSQCSNVEPMWTCS